MISEIGSILDAAHNPLIRMWRVEVADGNRPIWQHSHTNFEISLVTAGKGIYHTAKGDFPMQLGDVFVFASNEVHCISYAEGLKITNLQFAPRYLWGSSFDSMSRDHRNICFSHSDSFENRIPAKDAVELKVILLNLVKEFTAKQPEFGLMVKTHLNSFLVRLIRNFHYGDGTAVHYSQMKSIRTVITYVDEHLSEQLTLKDLAAMAGMSATYFSTLFKQVSGLTLWDYVISKRVEKAITLLEKEDEGLTILEIATLCGFNNTANFNKAFRRQTGITPSEYRKGTEYRGW